jgi:hypothetical protein
MDTCAMYEVFNLAGTLDVWKVRYCESNFEACERFKKASRAEPVPPTLLPNGSMLRR